MQNILKLTAVISAVISISACNSVAPAKSTLPNIVIIMGDDVGPGDVGYHHRKYTGTPALAETPAIDKLAKEGMTFTQAYAPTALCSPTRYSVMSGNLPHRSNAPWGVWQKFRPSPFTADDATLGRVAKQAGYNTGFIGKWHLGGDFYIKDTKKVYRGKDRGPQVLPADMTHWVAGAPGDLGFDYDFTIPSGVQGPIYMAFENSYWYPLGDDSKIININKQTAMEPKIVADKGPGMGDSNWNSRNLNLLIANKARDFIQDKSKSDKPFLLNYWSPAVHLPHLPPKEMAGDKIAGTTPTKHIDMIRVLDKEVEIIINTLKETGQYDNTLIIFTSDNGGLPDEPGNNAGHNSAGEWSGYKNSPLEGGHRIPTIAVWANKIKAGSSSNIMTTGSDIVATIAALTGVELTNKQALDSWNILPNLLGQAAPKRKVLAWQAGAQKELLYREGNWKLIMQSDAKAVNIEPIALYNLANDPKELSANNLVNSAKHNKRVKGMLKRYLHVRKVGQKSPM